MIVGTGIDIVAVARVTQALVDSPRLRERLFTEAELAAAERTLAGTFAAKEAIWKALGAPASLPWQHIEILRANSGQPQVRLTGSAELAATQRGVTRWHLSIAHDAGLAVAQAIAEK